MSPRAACRLETLGFHEVYDYVAGKADWLARGLTTEGEGAARPRVGELAIGDVVTCGPDERLAEVAGPVSVSRHGFALVVSGSRVLLGRLRRSALEQGGQRTAEQAMEPGAVDDPPGRRPLEAPRAHAPAGPHERVGDRSRRRAAGGRPSRRSRRRLE